MTNYFGLPFVSSKIAYANTPPNQFPTLSPGQTAVLTNYVVGLFHEAADPVLSTVKYVFLTREAIMPGHPGFTEDGLPQPFIIGMGRALSLAVWAKQIALNGDTNKPNYVSQYFAKAYKVDSYGQVTTNETGILSEYGEFFPTEPGRVILTTKPDADQGGIQGTALVHVIRLSLDANHDGVMDETFVGSDNTTSARPFRFWINNDHDEPASSDKPDRDLEMPGSPDYAYGRIRCQRNLEDFARLWIAGLPNLPPLEGYSATLSWRAVHGNPKINIYYAHAVDGGNGYLTETNEANGQFAQEYFNGQLVTDYARSLKQVASGVDYTLGFGEFSGQLIHPHYLFEGVGVGGGELVLSLRRNGVLIGESSQWLELDYVWNMFERAAVTNVQQYWPGMVEQALTSGVRVARTTAPDAPEAKELAVFVHGWRMTEWGARNFAETMFKRLYWQGYQGRFAALRWPTRSQETDPFLGLDIITYNRSEHIAFKSGMGATAYCNDLRRRFPDYTISVCAHSMGGIVMMQTLKEMAAANQASLDRLVLMQAAVPAHCYDSSVTNLPSLTAIEQLVPTPNTYGNYAAGISSALRGSIVNLFNPDDFALVKGVAGTGLGSWEFNQGFYAISTNDGPLTIKPNRFYGYYTDGTNSLLRTNYWNNNFFNYPLFYYGNGPTRAVTNVHELMPFVSRPRSKAVGAQASVQGQIQGGSVNLQSQFGFGAGSGDHSGQFNRNVQDPAAAAFYQELRTRLFPLP